MQEEIPLTDRIFFWNRLYKKSLLFVMSGALFLAASALTTIYLANRVRTPMWLVTTPWVLWGFFAWSLVQDRFSTDRPAVVVAEDLMARTADAAAAPARYSEPLPAGTEVMILGQRDDWARVRVANRETCWLPRSSLREIQP
jgi:hypothetical protein